MALPEDYRPRKGDVIAIHATIAAISTGDHAGKLFVDFGDGTWNVCKPENADRVISPKLEIGDDVLTADGHAGKIIAVHEGFAWIDAGTPSCFLTRVVSEVTRLDHVEVVPFGAGEIGQEHLDSEVLCGEPDGQVIAVA